MTRRRVAAWAAALLLGMGAITAAAPRGPLLAQAESAPNGVGRLEALVSRVIDGSSLDAHVNGARAAIGYLGVQTPLQNERCGEAALLRNRELAGARVLLEDDPLYQFDEIGRRLSYVYTADGRWIDELLIAEGLAWATRTEARQGAYLAAVQAEAEAAGRGCLWGG